MISCNTANLISLLGKKWTPHIISTFVTNGNMSFGDCKRAFPYMTDRMISLRLKELTSGGFLVIDEQGVYNPSDKLYEIDTVLQMMEKI